MKHILVVYHSQEKGNTRKMAELVAEGCRSVKGVTVEVVDVNTARVDIPAVEKADGLALGSPDYFSYVAGGVKQFFDDVCLASWAGRAVKAKPYVGFITHGGGGAASKSLESLAKALEFQPVAPVLLSKGAPSGPLVEQSRELGRLLARKVVGG